MRVLVFGGNRFMGKALVDELLDLNLDVTIFNRSGTGSPYVKIIKGDRNNEEDIKNLHLKNFDFIFDMCLFKPEQYKLMEKYLLESNPRKYTFISSASVGNKDFGDYAIEKEQVEKLIKESNLNYTIIRPVYVVGENSHRPRLGYYINKLKNNKPISIDGNGNKLINLVHIEDVVELIKSTMFTHDRKTIISSNGETLSVLDIINKIAKFLNIEEIKTEKGNESPFIDSKFVFDKTEESYKSLDDMLPEYYKWLELKGNKKYGY